jgi:hypothetical protein
MEGKEAETAAGASEKVAAGNGAFVMRGYHGLIYSFSAWL